MKKVIIITGQTATGKTSLALSLAHKKSGEIVSADSRQLYTHLDIITGKDKGDLRFVRVATLPGRRNFVVGYYVFDSIRIWGYDIVSPTVQFSSYNYKHVAEYIINNTIDKKSIPIVVGGTFFYIKHFLGDIEIQNEPDWNLRLDLEKKNVDELQHELRDIDPNLLESMNDSDRKNPRRIIRKIEIALSNSQEKKSVKSLFEIDSFIGLKFASNVHLRLTIAKRVEERLNAGAIDEVKLLLRKGYTRSDPGLNTIGYTQVLDFLNGELSYDEAVQKWINAEVQYAKRQYTLMKNDPRITWREV